MFYRSIPVLVFYQRISVFSDSGTGILPVPYPIGTVSVLKLVCPSVERDTGSFDRCICRSSLYRNPHDEELAMLLLIVVVALASGVLVGAVVPNLAPCRCGASRRPISQGGISHGISIAGCGCNSAARFPDSQPCREFQPHLANQCKVRLIPVSPDLHVQL